METQTVLILGSGTAIVAVMVLYAFAYLVSHTKQADNGGINKSGRSQACYLFQKGKAHLNKGQMPEAKLCLQNAVHLLEHCDPEESSLAGASGLLAGVFRLGRNTHKTTPYREAGKSLGLTDEGSRSRKYPVSAKATMHGKPCATA